MNDIRNQMLLSNANIEMTKKRHFEAYLQAASAYNNRFAMLSMMAYTQFCELTDIIEQTRHYKGRAKQQYNRCKKFYADYWKQAVEAFGDKYAIYIDYANMCVKSVEHDVHIFYYTIKSALDKIKASESDLKANILLTGELIRVCTDFHHDFWEVAAQKSGFRSLGLPFNYADPKPLMNIFSDFAGYICTQEEADVLDHDQNSRIALRAILAKCESEDNLGAAAREAVVLNYDNHPEYKELVKEVDDKRLAEIQKTDEKEDIMKKLSEKYKVKQL